MLEKESSFLVGIIRFKSCSQQERRLYAQSSLEEYHSIREWMASKVGYCLSGIHRFTDLFSVRRFLSRAG